MSLVVPEVTDLFNLLESNRLQDVNEIHSKFIDMFNSTKEPWLVYGLIEYHINTGSMRPIGILVKVPENHAKHLFDKLNEGIRHTWKMSSLCMLGHIVRREPSWLYKIANHSLMRELLRLLKVERDILILMNALLVLITLLPMIPRYVGPYFQDIFEIFSRLAAWDSNRSNDPASSGHREHLQLGLYGLFCNLYGMYPCNFIDFLRREYSKVDNQEVFTHTIKPMMETVRLHPLLVTASKQQETQNTRWQKMEYHDILFECRRFSLEGTEQQRTFEVEENRIRSRCGTDVSSLAAAAPHFEVNKSSMSAPNLTEAQTQMKTTVGRSSVDPTSIAFISKKHDNIQPGGEQWFSPADICDSGPTLSAPHTPLPVSSNTYQDTPISRTPITEIPVSLQSHDSGSPPEAAIEATPENTPIKDLRQRFNFPSNSPAVRALNTRLSHSQPLHNLPPHINPSQSQPPSPLKKEPSPFTGGAATDSQDYRKDAGYNRLNRVVLDRTQSEHTGASKQTSCPSPRKVRMSYSSNVPHVSSVPNSPVPLGTAVPTSTDWPLAKPKPKKDGIPLETSSSDILININDGLNKEDKEVTELSKRGDALRSGLIPREQDSRTPAETPEIKQHSRNYPDYTHVEGEEWCPDDETCEGIDHHCTEEKHGLHMPQSTSMLDFARRITTRFRFYSQCILDPPSSSFTKSSVMDKEEMLSKDDKIRRVSLSCPDFRKIFNISGQSSESGSHKDSDSKDVPNFMITSTNSKYKETKSMETQTVDAWPFPHEHLLTNVIQSFYEPPSKPKPSEDPSSTGRSSHLSISDQMDRYIETLSRNNRACSDFASQSIKFSDKEEIEHLRLQLQLTQLQLLYERHRKEAHAIRNRRLLGKCRKNRTTEEHNTALVTQFKSLQVENDELRQQINKQLNKIQTLDRQHQDELQYSQRQLLKLESDLQEERHSKEMLTAGFHELTTKYSEEGADLQNLQAALFDKSQKLDRAAKKSEMGDRLIDYVKLMQRELLICGEREIRIAEAVNSLPHANDNYLSKLLRQYKEELVRLQDKLNSSLSKLETVQIREAALESSLTQKEIMMQDLKKQSRLIAEEYSERLNAVEEKYRSLIRINQRLESHCLELLQRMPNNNSPHTVSRDLTSGFSPQSSPLSASLASSEGHGALLGSHVEEIRNLQVIVNQQSFDEAGPSTSGMMNSDDDKH